MGTQCTLYTLDTVFILMLYYSPREPTKAHKLWKETSKRDKKSNKLESSTKIDKSSEILLFHKRKYCEAARNANLIIKTKHKEAIKNMISRLSQITENPF